MKEQIAIIDIGSSTIVTLIGERGVNGTMNIIGKGEIAYAGFQNSEFLEPEHLKFAIASSISNAEELADTKITEIYVGVPGEFSAVFTKEVPLQFPKQRRITSQDVEAIYKKGNTFEDEPIYSLIGNSVIYYSVDDSQKFIDPVGQKATKVVGLVSYMLALKSYIQLMKNVFSELKISVRGFISSVFAESLFLFDPELRDKYVLFADIGHITTNVALVRGNGLLFMSSFSMGGGYISADLSQCLRIPFAEANRLKNKVVLAWQPESTDTYVIEGGEHMKTCAAKATNEIVTDRVEMICDYISKCLDLCRFDIPSFLPLYITGGGFGSIRGVRNVMSRRLKRQVLLAMPKSLQVVRPFNSSEEGLLNLLLNHSEMLKSLIIEV